MSILPIRVGSCGLNSEKLRESREERGAHSAELFVMDQGQPPEHALSPGGNLHQDFTKIGGVRVAPHHPEPSQTIREFYDAVVFELELPGERSNGGMALLRKSLDGEQELMLLRPETRRAGGLLAEDDEPADQMAEGSEGPVFARGRA